MKNLLLIMFIIIGAHAGQDYIKRSDFTLNEYIVWAEAGVINKNTLSMIKKNSAQTINYAESQISSFIKRTGIKDPKEAKKWKDIGVKSSIIKKLKEKKVSLDTVKKWKNKRPSLIDIINFPNINAVIQTVENECKDFNGDKACLSLSFIINSEIVNNKLVVTDLRQQDYYLLDFNGEVFKNNSVLEEYSLLNYENTRINIIGYANKQELVDTNDGKIRIDIVDVLAHPLKEYNKNETVKNDVEKKTKKPTSNYESCIDNSDGNTGSMHECNLEELKYQDTLLNKNYKLVMQKLSDEEKMKLTMKKLQRLWVKYRDANCDFLYNLTGGTMDILNGDSCLIEMTTKRAVELNDLTEML